MCFADHLYYRGTGGVSSPLAEGTVKIVGLVREDRVSELETVSHPTVPVSTRFEKR